MCQSEALIITKIPVENLTEKRLFKAHYNLKKETLTYDFNNETYIHGFNPGLIHSLRVQL